MQVSEYFFRILIFGTKHGVDHRPLCSERLPSIRQEYPHGCWFCWWEFAARGGQAAVPYWIGGQNANGPLNSDVTCAVRFEHSGNRLYSVIGNGTCLLEMNTSLASPFQCYFETFFWSKWRNCPSYHSKYSVQPQISDKKKVLASNCQITMYNAQALKFQINRKDVLRIHDHQK